MDDTKDPREGLTEATVIYLAGLTPLQKLQEIRKAAKQFKVPVRDLEKLVKAAKSATAGEVVDDALAHAKQSDVLISLAKTAKLFHTPAPDRDAFACLKVDDHLETMRVRSDFRKWLRHAYFQKTKSGCSTEALQVSIETLASIAEFEGDEIEVNTRIAEHDGAIYIDLGDASWRAIKITADGWNVIANPPVHFRRASTTRALPVPERGGSINDLRPLVNVKSEQDFVLLVSYLLASLRPNTVYPVLVVVGQHGSAKTSLASLIVRLTDPRMPDRRSMPREEDNLIVAAKTAHLLSFDNVSRIRLDMSDALCRLSTGSGAGKRRLFTDDEEVLFFGRRPIVLNGITDFAEQPDLLARCIILTLDPIPDVDRREETLLHAEIERAAPKIFGALLDGLAAGLRNIDRVSIPNLPRMADLTKWVEACTSIWWPEGTFLTAYRQNLAGAVELSIDANPVAKAVRTFMQDRDAWSGTAEALLTALTATVSEGIARDREWPRLPHLLSGQLRRAAPDLGKVGIQIRWSGGHRHGRLIYITKNGGDIDPDKFRKTVSPASPAVDDYHQGDAEDAEKQHLSASAPPPFSAEPVTVDPKPECARCGVPANGWGPLVPCGENGSAGLFHLRCWTEERTKGPRRKPALGPPGDDLGDLR